MTGLRPRRSQVSVLTGEANAILSTTDRHTSAWPSPRARAAQRMYIWHLEIYKALVIILKGLVFFLKLLLWFKMAFCSQRWVSTTHNWKWPEEGGQSGGRHISCWLILLLWKQVVLLDFVHCRWCKEQTFPFFSPKSHDVILVIENNLLKLFFN